MTDIEHTITPTMEQFAHQMTQKDAEIKVLRAALAEAFDMAESGKVIPFAMGKHWHKVLERK